MSGDRRVRRTWRAVQQALVALILEKGYEAVTVTDIIDRADIGRSTFYAHFTDKQDVLLSNLDELGFLRPASEGPPGELFAFSLPMFEHVQEQRQLVRALLGRGGAGNMLRHGERLLAAMVRDDLAAAGVRASPERDLLVICVVGAFMALVRAWADGEIPATPAELDHAFRAAIGPGVRAVLPLQPGDAGR